MIRTVVVAGFAGLLATAAFAADPASRNPAAAAPAAATSCKESEKSALATDVFGFTTGSDVSDVGAYGMSVEYNGNYGGGGFKPGSFQGHLGKVQFATALIPCWEIGPYLLGTKSRGTNDWAFGAVGYSSFGGGVENKLKLLGRDTHGIGVTLDVDMNYQGFRQSDTTLAIPLSWNGGQFNSSYRIFIDKEIVAGKLFGAINLVWDQIWTQRPAITNPLVAGDYARNSNLTASASLSYQVLDGLFIGAEARYVRTHNGAAFNFNSGDAYYLGPTMFWQATKQVAITGAWGMQVAGNTNYPMGVVPSFPVVSSNLNLVTQNQHIAKLKLVVGF